MDQLATVLRGVIDRLLNVFQVLDLSFFLPGGICILALMVLTDVYAPIAPLLTDAGAAMGVLLVIQAYLCGLVCFGLGRLLRRKVAGPWGAGRGKVALGGEVRARLEAHGLEGDAAYAPYFDAPADRADAAFGQLYARLWADIRQDKELAPSFELLHGYWVRAAVYDGMSVALLAWGVVGFLGERHSDWADGATAGRLLVAAMDGPWALYGVLATVFASVAICWREARRLDRYQVEELVGTFASRANRDNEARRLHAEHLVEAASAEALPGLAADLARAVAGADGWTSAHAAAFAAAFEAPAGGDPVDGPRAAEGRLQAARAAAQLAAQQAAAEAQLE